jgi:hypothetical protein
MILAKEELATDDSISSEKSPWRSLPGARTCRDLDGLHVGYRLRRESSYSSTSGQSDI